MVKAIDMDKDNRTAMPDVPSIVELTKYYIPSERHAAYETMWAGLTYFGVVSNAVMWLYL
jgi:hypothetical protein